MSSSHPHDNPFRVVRASAGTGKTYQLSSRYIGLLNRDVAVDEILATTFTKKAAGEITERVLLRLAKAVCNSDDLQEMATAIAVPELDHQRCAALLRRLVDSLHRLRIGTLDSYFAQLATTGSLELGLPPGWQVADDATLVRLQMDAIDALLENNPTGEVRRIMHLVGKGTHGRRVSEVIRNNVQELHQWYLASDERCWNRVNAAKPLEPAEVADLLTRLAAAPLPDHKGATKAQQTALERAEHEEWDLFVKEGLAAKVLDGSNTYQRKDIPPETVEIYAALNQHARAVLRRQLANQNAATYELLDKFHEQYVQLRSDHGVLYFADVIHALVTRIHGSDSDRNAYRMNSSISHLLLDEFQDTSSEQWEVLKPLARQIVESENSSFFCVGDVKQAIYGWRGGEARLFDALEEQLPNLEVSPLNMSYRSAEAITHVTNEIFQQLLHHENLDDFKPAIRRWCDGFQTHDTHWKTRAGHVTLETAPQSADGELSKEVTLAYAADRITALVAQIPRRSIGVLLRKNESVSRMIYELGRRQVQASAEGGKTLCDSAAVQLIVSLAEWIDNPDNNLARFHLQQSPLAKALDLPLESDPTSRAATAALLRATLATAGYGPTVATWAGQLVCHTSQREARRLRELVNLAYSYDKLATLRPGDFAEFVRHTSVEIPEMAPVRVMTIHQAKGLEFDIVVLPELDESLTGQPGTVAIEREHDVGPVETVCLYRNETIRQLLPASLSNMLASSKERQIEDALCRLYVAVTRAAYALHMIIAPSKPNERKIPKTAAGLVRAALVNNDRVDANQMLYAYGDTKWAEHETSGMQTSLPVDPGPLTVQLAEMPAGTTSQRQWTTPSELEGAQQRQPAHAFRISRAAGLGQGTLLHTWFEQIDWLDDGLPDESVWPKVAREKGVSQTEIARALPDFLTLLHQAPFSDLLSRRCYAPPDDLGLDPDIARELTDGPLELEVLCESRIAAMTQEHLLTGNVDRLVLMRRGDHLLAADIIDFKSDQIGDEKTLGSRVDHYRPQINAYRTAIAQMYRLDPRRVSTRLAFTTPQRVVNIAP